MSLSLSLFTLILIVHHSPDCPSVVIVQVLPLEPLPPAEVGLEHVDRPVEGAPRPAADGVDAVANRDKACRVARVGSHSALFQAFSSNLTAPLDFSFH